MELPYLAASNDVTEILANRSQISTFRRSIWLGFGSLNMSLLHLDAFAHMHTRARSYFHTDTHRLIVETRFVCGSVGSFELQTTCNSGI